MIFLVCLNDPYKSFMMPIKQYIMFLVYVSDASAID